ncbi:MATE family efflux transporter [bacterium]|jgi:Na+-driven multidrug efflux pump|nr:MATE family efflux transporter [bacterium]
MIKRFFKNVSLKRDLTNGNIAGHIWFLSLPIIVTNLLQTLFNLVDMFWVGKLGPDAIAAVAMSGTILMIVMFFMIGIGAGTTALISRFIGAKENAQADNTAMQSITMSFFISVIMSAAGYFYSPWLLEILGASSEVVMCGTGYLQIIFASIFIMFFLFLISAIFQGAGDVKTPMLLLAFSTLINIILDPLLIFGIGPFPEMGINGAAWATVISRAIGSIIALEILLKGRSLIHVRLSEYRLDLDIMWRIFKIGISSSAQMSFRSMMNLAIMALVASFGTFAVVAYGIGTRLEMIVIMPGFGFAGAAATLVGQNLGAQNSSRAEKSGWVATSYYAVFMVAMTLIFLAFAPFLVSIFNNNSEVVRLGTTYLRIMAFSFIFTAVGMTLNRSIIGAGDTFPAMVNTFIGLWVVLIPLALYLSKHTSLGLNGIWLAMLISSAVLALLNTIYFKSGKWKLKKV